MLIQITDVIQFTQLPDEEEWQRRVWSSRTQDQGLELSAAPGHHPAALSHPRNTHTSAAHTVRITHTSAAHTVRNCTGLQVEQQYSEKEAKQPGARGVQVWMTQEVPAERATPLQRFRAGSRPC